VPERATANDDQDHAEAATEDHAEAAPEDHPATEEAPAEGLGWGPFEAASRSPITSHRGIEPGVVVSRFGRVAPLGLEPRLKPVLAPCPAASGAALPRRRAQPLEPLV
jgi:hypothetical protein